MMARPGGGRWLLRLLSCIRFDEVLVLQGTPLLGAIFAMSHLGAPGAQNLTRLSLLIAGNVFLVAHVFLLNDWSGIHQDIRDPARSDGVFLDRGVRSNDIRALLFVLLVLAMIVLSRLGPSTLGVGLMIAAASAFYSVPRVYVKGIPLASSLLHLVSGVLHFLLGYSAFRRPDASGLEIGLFFALIFSAGHLTQEVRDRDADLGNGIQTNAVRFGKTRAFIASFALFTLADVLLIVLAMRDVMPTNVALFVVALYPLHLYWALRALRSGLRFESVRRLQLRYRMLYACVGGVMVMSMSLS